MNTPLEKTPTPLIALLLVGLALAGTASAQSELGSAIPLPKFRDVEAGREAAEWRSTDSASEPRTVELGVELFAPAADEELSASLAVEPPPVSRGALEGTGEGLHSYHGLPGGIVLGLAARAQGPLELALEGARIERGASDELVLRLADGRALRCPRIAPDVLAACLAFTAQARDALVDLTHDLGAKPRLAPAFAGGALAEMLVRMDGVPHRVRPETRLYKSLIVDRDVRSAALGEELVLSAELEVRLYADALDSGWAHRASTLEAVGPEFVGPRRVDDLSEELAPLAELAAWLGFLRRVEGLDPAGVAALRASLAHAR